MSLVAGWGGSAFRVGVFSRKHTEDKSFDAKLSYSAPHGGYSLLGTTAGETFERGHQQGLFIDLPVRALQVLSQDCRTRLTMQSLYVDTRAAGNRDPGQLEYHFKL